MQYGIPYNSPNSIARQSLVPPNVVLRPSTLTFLAELVRNKQLRIQPRISYPAKLSFISEEEKKSFTDKQLLRDIIATRPALQELMKEVQNREWKNQ